MLYYYSEFSKEKRTLHGETSIYRCLTTKPKEPTSERKKFSACGTRFYTSCIKGCQAHALLFNFHINGIFIFARRIAWFVIKEIDGHVSISSKKCLAQKNKCRVTRHSLHAQQHLILVSPNLAAFPILTALLTTTHYLA